VVVGVVMGMSGVPIQHVPPVRVILTPQSPVTPSESDMKLSEFLEGVSRIKVRVDHIHGGQQVLVNTDVLNYSCRSEEYKTVTYGSVTLPLDVEITNFTGIQIGDRARREAVVWMGNLRVIVDPLEWEV